MAQYTIVGIGCVLRMDGTGVTSFSAHGGGAVNASTQEFGPWDIFEIVQHLDGTVNIASVAFPGVFLRMDGTGVDSFTASGGGTVNCQFGAGPWETFTLNPVDQYGLVTIESVAFPNVYLRMVEGEAVNCQYTPGEWERVVINLLSPETLGNVPDLINPSPAQAIAVTQADGFLYATTTNAVAAVFDPHVESQFPPSPNEWPLGSIVTVTIAVPTLGVVPDVTSKSPSDAVAKIREAGFVPTETQDEQPGIVTPYVEAQDPLPETTAPLGSAVNITVAVREKGPLR